MSDDFVSQLFKQSVKNTFCLVPRLFASIEVTQNNIIFRDVGQGTMTLPINSSTRAIYSVGWGYVCVDVNCDHEKGKFQEQSYPRVRKPRAFIRAVYAAIDSQKSE